MWKMPKKNEGEKKPGVGEKVKSVFFPRGFYDESHRLPRVTSNVEQLVADLSTLDPWVQKESSICTISINHQRWNF